MSLQADERGVEVTTLRKRSLFGSMRFSHLDRTWRDSDREASRPQSDRERSGAEPGAGEVPSEVRRSADRGTDPHRVETTCYAYTAFTVLHSWYTDNRFHERELVL